MLKFKVSVTDAVFRDFEIVLSCSRIVQLDRAHALMLAVAVVSLQLDAISRFAPEIPAAATASRRQAFCTLELATSYNAARNLS